MPLPLFNPGTAANAKNGDTPRAFALKANDLSSQAEQRLASLELFVQGNGGGGSMPSGTAAGQTWEWTGTLWVLRETAEITSLSLKHVEVSGSGALVRSSTNDSTVVAVAGTSFSLATTEVGTGWHFLMDNETASTLTITYAAGFTMRRLGGAPGTGNTVTVPGFGTLACRCYPRGSLIVARVQVAAP